jgi:hypothetical protein
MLRPFSTVASSRMRENEGGVFAGAFIGRDVAAVLMLVDDLTPGRIAQDVRGLPRR